MSHLTGYFDASGARHASGAIVVGGFLSQQHAWKRFGRDWQRALDAHGLTEMHLAPFMSNRPPYSSWRGRESQKADLLRQLSEIIAANTQKCFCEEVALADWCDVDRMYKLSESRCTPYSLAAYTMVSKIMEWWSRRRHTHVDFVFEHGDTDQSDFGFLMDSAISLSPMELGALAPRFVSKRDAVPLQAADFAAWVVRRARLVALGDEEKSLAPDLVEAFQPLVRIEGKNRWGRLDADRLIDFCRRYDVPLKEETRTWVGIQVASDLRK